VSTRGRFPFRFFVIRFAWSWLVWLPLVLGYHGVGPIDRDTVVAITMPLTPLLAAFGPAVGAVYSLKTLDGWAPVRRYLRGLFDLRLVGEPTSEESSCWEDAPPSPGPLAPPPRKLRPRGHLGIVALAPLLPPVLRSGKHPVGRVHPSDHRLVLDLRVDSRGVGKANRIRPLCPRVGKYLDLCVPDTHPGQRCAAGAVLDLDDPDLDRGSARLLQSKTAAHTLGAVLSEVK
jgi:hypothetical protein